MNFISSSSDYNPLVNNGVIVVNDEDKGRCYEAVMEFNVGHVIFTEKALVYGSYEDDDDDEVNMEIMQQAFDGRIKNFKDNVSVILDEICRLDKVQSLDTARCFLQLLALQQLNNEGKLADQHVIQSLDLLSTMTACNLNECLQDVKKLKKVIPKLIHTISDSEAARYLAILNTNQLELEQYGGSGLFVATAIMEHNCDCNCSYSTHENMLYMTAIKDIKIGDRLTIDYGNNYYHPTSERQQSLLDTYKFTCNCSKCTGIDKRRPFLCIFCRCYFYPIGRGPEGDEISIDNFFTPCLMCQQRQPNEYIVDCLKNEEEYLSNPPETYDLIIERCQSYFDENHYLVFFTLHDLALALCSEARNSNKDAASKFSEGLKVMTTVVRIFCNNVTEPHHEKVLFYDKLAQVALASNNINLAKTYFQDAYQEALQAVGENTPLAQKLHSLATNTPRTIAELQQSY